MSHYGCKMFVGLLFRVIYFSQRSLRGDNMEDVIVKADAVIKSLDNKVRLDTGMR